MPAVMCKLIFHKVLGYLGEFWTSSIKGEACFLSTFKFTESLVGEGSLGCVLCIAKQ